MPARPVPGIVLVLACLATGPVLAQQQPTQPAQERTESILDQLLSDHPAGADADIVARYEQAVVTRDQLMTFLMQTRGLDAMLNLMQLQMAKVLAANEGIVVTRADVEAEERETLMQAFAAAGEEINEDQYDDLLAQLRTQQQLSLAEFDVIMATNAYLKALARPQIDRMLTDGNLRRAFNIRYGEQVRVRHIQLENLAQVAEVRKRLEAGEDFAAVAAQVSRNPDTKQVGGMFPPFSMQSEIPEPFKITAFELKVGQVSDPVEAGGYYHLIKLEERIEPKAVVFEDVKDDLKETVAQEQVLVVTTRLRRLLAQMLASDNLKIADPVLAEQLRLRLEQVRPQPTDPAGMKRQLESDRPTTGPGRPTTAPTTPTTPATGPAPTPGNLSGAGG